MWPWRSMSTRGVCKRAAVILGAAAPVPHRAKAAEAVLTGKRIDENIAAEAGRAALDGATPLSKNAYKLPLFETLVRRAILKTSQRDGKSSNRRAAATTSARAPRTAPLASADAG